jgi:hypothetical protein
VASRSQARFIAKWSAELERFPALPEADADPWARDIVDERALLASRRSHRRVLVVDRGEPGDRSRAAAVVDDLPGWQIAVATSTPDDADRFAGRGVEVIDGDLTAHLSRPTVLYDAVAFLRAADFEDLAPAVRALQPQAAVVYDVADATTDVLRIAEAASSAAGSPLVRADHLVCRGGFDASLLALVPGRAPVGGSVAEALASARAEALRIRSAARPCGGRPR